MMKPGPAQQNVCTVVVVPNPDQSRGDSFSLSTKPFAAVQNLSKLVVVVCVRCNVRPLVVVTDDMCSTYTLIEMRRTSYLNYVAEFVTDIPAGANPRVTATITPAPARAELSVFLVEPGITGG